MTIHHDKLAYGKLAAASEEISAEAIAEMNRKLAQFQADEEKKREEGKEGKRTAELEEPEESEE